VQVQFQILKKKLKRILRMI